MLNDISQRYSNFMDDCHAFYLFQEILRTIIGSVDTAHTKYEAYCLDWQSVNNDDNELLCKADILQFKELCNNNYMLCKDEYDLHKHPCPLLKKYYWLSPIMSPNCEGPLIGWDSFFWYSMLNDLSISNTLFSLFS